MVIQQQPFPPSPQHDHASGSGKAARAGRTGSIEGDDQATAIRATEPDKPDGTDGANGTGDPNGAGPTGNGRDARRGNGRDSGVEMKYNTHPPPDTPFLYGFRYVLRYDDSEEELDQVPLTLEDVLHPELEDKVSQNDRHALFCHYLYATLRAHLRHDPSVVVMQDVPINWGVEEMKDHCPDVSVLQGVHTRFPDGVFPIKKSGGAPLLFIEVTSKSTRILDVDSEKREKNKYRQYAQVNVPWYLIIDLAKWKDRSKPPPVMLYRLKEQQGEQQEQQEKAEAGEQEQVFPNQPDSLLDGQKEHNGRELAEGEGEGEGEGETAPSEVATELVGGEGYAFPPAEDQPADARATLPLSQYEEILPDKQGWLWVKPVGLYLAPYDKGKLLLAWYDKDGRVLLDYEELTVQWEWERERAERAEQERETEARTRAEAEARLRELEAELRRLRGQ
jgi:Uma2 family endonuclease